MFSEEFIRGDIAVGEFGFLRARNIFPFPNGQKGLIPDLNFDILTPSLGLGEGGSAGKIFTIMLLHS